MVTAATRFPERATASLESELAPVDVETLRRQGTSLDWYIEGFREGARGIAHDYLLEGSPWGFDVEDVRTPVQIVHGDADATVVPQHGRWLAEHIPQAQLRVVEGEGHLFPLKLARELLEETRP